MDVLRPRWMIPLAACLLGGFCAAIYWNDSTAGANFSSIWGLCVSVVGFVITIATMLQTQHIAREAQRRIQEAADRSEKSVADAYRQVRLAMEKTSMVLLVSEVEQFLQLVTAARNFGDTGDWMLAVHSYQQGLALIPRLSGNPLLGVEGEAAIHGAEEALLSVVPYINRRLERKDISPHLRKPHADTIPVTIQTVSGILTRLRKQAMEAPNGP
jgi:heme/copper-type cytochrome/quinol oxidase subunit 1